MGTIGKRSRLTIEKYTQDEKQMSNGRVTIWKPAFRGKWMMIRLQDQWHDGIGPATYGVPKQGNLGKSADSAMLVGTRIQHHDHLLHWKHLFSFYKNTLDALEKYGHCLQDRHNNAQASPEFISSYLHWSSASPLMMLKTVPVFNTQLFKRPLFSTLGVIIKDIWFSMHKEAATQRESVDYG